VSGAASVRLLADGDAAAMAALLAPHADSSMFLRSNSRRAGFVDRGAPLTGAYAAVFTAGGAIVAVAAHFWNGMLVVQSPDPAHIAPVARAAAAATGRRVTGFAGPHAQVVAARAALGLAGAPANVDSCEVRYGLELAELRVPDAVADGRLRARRATDADLPLTTAWRVAYMQEALAAPPSPELEPEARGVMASMRDVTWLLVDGAASAAPVALTQLNAFLPDIVQIGGVYTPPAHRGRGYASAVVAAQLLDVRAGGASRVVLFTQPDNASARAAYESIGFRLTGDFGLVLLA
jgi:predicted GNAT family acetyltransferase